MTIIRGLVIAVVTAALTAAATWLITDYLNRAKPGVDIVSIDIGPAKPPSAQFEPSFELSLAYDRLPLQLDEYSPKRMSLETAQLALRDAEDWLDSFRHLQSLLDESRSKIKTYSQDSNNQLRKELLQVMGDTRGNMFEETIKRVLRSRGLVERLSAEENYRTHPIEWKDRRRASLTIRAGEIVDLSETDESTYDGLESNIFSRVFIRLDRQLLSEVYDYALDDIRSQAEDLNDFVAKMETELGEQNTARLRLTASIANFGKYPSIVSGSGILRILVSGKEYKVRVARALDGVPAPAVSFVVKPGDVESVEFVSVDPVAELHFQEDGGGNVETLFESEVVECTIDLYAATGTTSGEIVSPRARAIFGASQVETVWSKLDEKKDR